MSETPINTEQSYVEKNEGNYLNPLESVMSYARESVFAVAPHFEAAGATKEITESAANLASESAKAEFETMEKMDPLRRLQEILIESISTVSDKEIVMKCATLLEQDRASWIYKLRQEKTRMELDSSEGEYSVERALIAVRRVNQAPTFVEPIRGVSFVSFDLLAPTWINNSDVAPGSYGQTREKPSAKCIENALKGLGVLKPTEKVSDLRKLPNRGVTEDGHPRYDQSMDKAEYLSTNISGCIATLYDRFSRVVVSFDKEAFEKIVNFPASV